jgi:hypothetical protein
VPGTPAKLLGESRGGVTIILAMRTPERPRPGPEEPHLAPECPNVEAVRVGGLKWKSETRYISLDVLCFLVS